MQRLMQALGAYGYLGLVKKNRAFLAHIPAALDSLGEVLTEIEGLEPLGELASALCNDARSVPAASAPYHRSRLQRRTKGFPRRSAPIVVGGPWPGRTVTLSPNG